MHLVMTLFRFSQRGLLWTSLEIGGMAECRTIYLNDGITVAWMVRSDSLAELTYETHKYSKVDRGGSGHL